jgi:HSP20 family protein
MTLMKVTRPKPVLNPFDQLFNGFFNDEFLSNTQFTVPSVNVKETEKDYVIEVAAPGMKKKDFHINVENDVLTISADQEVKNEEKTDNYIKKEFSYSQFSRSFTLPEIVNQDQILAKYKDGVLEVSLPKSEEALAKKIREISVN